MSLHYRALTTFKLEGEVTSLSESSQEEVGDNREKWGEFCEKLIAINRNIVINFQPSRTCCLKKKKPFSSMLHRGIYILHTSGTFC